MSVPEARQVDVLDNLLPDYQAEGYEVYVNPSRSILPPFMRDHPPDAIALRTDKKIAIEVVRSQQTSSHKIRELQSLLASHSDWELRVHYVSPLDPTDSPDVVSASAINASIGRVIDLKNAAYKLPALVMAWSTLEAIGRALLPDRLRRAQTPARLVEVLASDGYLTPQEADTLRSAISLRNSAVHGDVDQIVDDKLLDQFAIILQTLQAFLAENDSTVRGR